jgi:hypothetical protein
MLPKTKTLLIAACLVAIAIVPLCALHVISVGVALKAAAGLCVVGMALQNAVLSRDYGTKVTKALPNGAATIYTDGLDLGHTENGIPPLGSHLEIAAPLLAFADLGDAATMKYDVQCDTDSAFGSATTLAKEVVVQTGAGGVGAAAQTVLYAIPPHCERYIRVAATNSAAGDASDKSVIANLVFAQQ